MSSEGPHLLICFKRNQKTTKYVEFPSFWMLVSYFKYKVRQSKNVCGLDSGHFSLICFLYFKLRHATSAFWSFLLWKVKNRNVKLLLVAQTEMHLKTQPDVLVFSDVPFVCWFTHHVLWCCIRLSPMRVQQSLRWVRRRPPAGKTLRAQHRQGQVVSAADMEPGGRTNWLFLCTC